MKTHQFQNILTFNLNKKNMKNPKFKGKRKETKKKQTEGKSAAIPTEFPKEILK